MQVDLAASGTGSSSSDSSNSAAIGVAVAAVALLTATAVFTVVRHGKALEPLAVDEGEAWGPNTDNAQGIAPQDNTFDTAAGDSPQGGSAETPPRKFSKVRTSGPTTPHRPDSVVVRSLEFDTPNKDDNTVPDR